MKIKYEVFCGGETIPKCELSFGKVQSIFELNRIYAVCSIEASTENNQVILKFYDFCAWSSLKNAAKQLFANERRKMISRALVGNNI